MSDEQEEAKPVLEALRETWKHRDIPTFFVDGFIGAATQNGVERLTFYELIFNPAEGATFPSARPVINIAIPRVSLLQLARDIVAAADAVNGAPDAAPE